jgi:putative addiction module component (TIGR02574 family)
VWPKCTHRCWQGRARCHLTPALPDATVRGMQLTPEEINQLSPQQRLNLIGQLWDSLNDAETPLPPAQEAELERRLATLDHDRPQAVTWERLKVDLAQRCP